jgi:cobalamin biosynthesis protein CobD/CbiB
LIDKNKKQLVMGKLINWISTLFKDEKGNPSSKRFVGIVAGLSLCITLFANQFSEEHIAPSPVLINAVAALAFGALGLASADKIWGKKGGDGTQE